MTGKWTDRISTCRLDPCKGLSKNHDDKDHGNNQHLVSVIWRRGPCRQLTGESLTQKGLSFDDDLEEHGHQDRQKVSQLLQIERSCKQRCIEKRQFCITISKWQAGSQMGVCDMMHRHPPSPPPSLAAAGERSTIHYPVCPIQCQGHKYKKYKPKYKYEQIKTHFIRDRISQRKR